MFGEFYAVTLGTHMLNLNISIWFPNIKIYWHFFKHNSKDFFLKIIFLKIFLHIQTFKKPFH